MDNSKTPLHAKIEQMLTEARVILPGTQALLGFQMIVMLTPAFQDLPTASKYAHFVALSANVLSIVLLISPAAVHRMTFGGQDAARMHTVGSLLVTLALAPLAIGISLDLYVAFGRLFQATQVAEIAAAAACLLMASLWYGLPIYISRTKRVRH